MGENTVFLLLTALIRNFYKFIMERLEVKKFGLKATSRIKAFVFKFISVPAYEGCCGFEDETLFPGFIVS